MYMYTCMCSSILIYTFAIFRCSGRHKQEESLFEEMLQVSQAIVRPIQAGRMFYNLSEPNCFIRTPSGFHLQGGQGGSFRP